MAIQTRVLFLCTENSCRTQIAEAFLREMTGDEFEIVSAGAEAGRLDPDAVAAMQEVGIDISSAHTKVVDPYSGNAFTSSLHFATAGRSGRVPYSRAQSGGRNG
jgi:protein-tyrosine-phosphatase